MRYLSVFLLLLGDAGLMATYHAKNEYCLLSDMCQGYQVFASIISQLEEWILFVKKSPYSELLASPFIFIKGQVQYRFLI